MSDKDRAFILRTVVLTLSVVIVMMVGSMIYGLFDTRVDNDQIISVIGPAFTTIIGAFVGLLGGLMITKGNPPAAG